MIRLCEMIEWAGGGVYKGNESVPIIGLIGMGVEGWDMSAPFGSSEAGITRRIGNINNQFDRFDHLTHQPAVARTLYRGDILAAVYKLFWSKSSRSG